MVQAYEPLSVRQACKIFNLSSSVYRYQAKRSPEDTHYCQVHTTLAERQPTWGFWKMYSRLRLDGHTINHKRLYRIYGMAKLTMGRKTRKRIPARVKQPLVQPLCPNLTWGMDFMRDSLFQGKPFRAFNVIDDFNREALNITIAKSITSERVIMELEKLIEWRGKPLCLRVDNGPEFIAHALQEWCDQQQPAIELRHIEKGSPSQNGYVEQFNRTFREDILDPNIFIIAGQAQIKAHDWMWNYNNYRPHEALNNLPPITFMLKYGKLHPHPTGQTEFPTFQHDDNQKKLIKNYTFELS